MAWFIPRGFVLSKVSSQDATGYNKVDNLFVGGALLFNRLPMTIDAAAAVNVHYYLSRGWTVDLVMGRGWADQSEHVSMSKKCLHVP